MIYILRYDDIWLLLYTLLSLFFHFTYAAAIYTASLPFHIYMSIYDIWYYMRPRACCLCFFFLILLWCQPRFKILRRHDIRYIYILQLASFTPLMRYYIIYVFRQAICHDGDVYIFFCFSFFHAAFLLLFSSASVSLSHTFALYWCFIIIIEVSRYFLHLMMILLFAPPSLSSRWETDDIWCCCRHAPLRTIYDIHDDILRFITYAAKICFYHALLYLKMPTALR